MTNLSKELCEICGIEPEIIEGIDCAWCMSIECPTKESKMTDKEQVTNSKEQTNGSLKNQDKNFNENFTQEKEQIIIDGVEVLKEKINMCFILLLNKLETPETIEQTIYEHLDAFVKEWNTQLARKTQECEELKKQVETSEKWRIKAESLNEKLDLKNTYYRKALEEIEEYIYNNTDFDINDSIQSKTAGYDILQIIKDV